MPDMEIRNFAYHANTSFNLRVDAPKFGSSTTMDTKSLNTLQDFGTYLFGVRLALRTCKYSINPYVKVTEPVRI